MRRFLTVLLFAAIGPGAQAQRLDPGDYIYPIRDVARLYAANFGEMRPAHFHAGVDIKTDGAEGKPLVAVADGYVSRVSLTAGGYGRAVYLTLRNGTTAVYGHLQRFRDDIEEHVRQERTARRANSVNLWFGPEAWPVKQGDVIGFSGNSGSSMGPHLHFEIRDTSGSTTSSARASSAPRTTSRPASCVCITSRSTPCKAFLSAAAWRAMPWSARPKDATA